MSFDKQLFASETKRLRTSSGADRMSLSERASFRLFCEQASHAQLENIVNDETRRASSGSAYFIECRDIAIEVAMERELMV